jgi:hypothetical protein
MKRLVVRLDRDTQTWLWESMSIHDSARERCPAGLLTAQAAIVDARSNWSWVDGDCVTTRRKHYCAMASGRSGLRRMITSSLPV